MADNRNRGSGVEAGNCFKEAVCIDASRVYDSCADKDCLEDLKVFFTDCTQRIVDSASSIRCRDAEVITCLIDIEEVPFNRGCYSVDLTFFFKIHFEAFSTPAVPVYRYFQRNAYCTEAKEMLKYLHHNFSPMISTTSLCRRILIRGQKCSALIPLLLPHGYAKFIIAANHAAICRHVLKDSSREVLRMLIPKKKYLSHWDYSLLFSLNAMFSYLFPHMISVFRIKNATAIRKIRATLSEKSDFRLTISSRRRSTTIAETAMILRDKANKTNRNRPKFSPTGFFLF